MSLENITIDNMPYPARVRIVGSKYDEIFDSLKPGQRIKLSAADASKVSGALRKWLERNQITDQIVRQVKRCPDGHAGIWVVPKPAERKKAVKMADIPGRLVSPLGSNDD